MTAYNTILQFFFRPIQSIQSTNTMAGTDLYYASVPLFKNGLQILKNILTKATEHYGPNTPHSDILNATLIEDLRPLVTHVQLCSNISKKSVARMATDLNPEVWEDNEDTVEKLIERCEKTIAMLDGVAPEQVNGREDERVEMQVGPLKMEMSVREQLFNYAIPFFFFHLQFVYSILRMKGVPLGFADFLMSHIQPYLVQ